MRTLPVSSVGVKFSNSFRAAEAEEKKADAPVTSPANTEKKTNVSQLVTAAVAVAALGVSAYTLKGRGAKSAGENKIDNIKNELKAEIEKLQQELKNQTNSKEETPSDIKDKLDSLTDKVNNLDNSGLKNDIMNQINSLRETIKNITTQATSKVGFFSEVVNVNGKDLVLGQVLNPVEGATKDMMEQTLRTESTRRLLGIGNKINEMPNHAILRMPTSEFKGFASTGGMAAVPKEIADNIARLVAGKQDVTMVVDIPLYRGTVEKGSVKDTLTTRFNDLIPLNDGTFKYIQTSEQREKGVLQKTEISTLGILKKIGSMDVKILTDNGPTTEKVDTYLHERTMNLDYKTVEQNFSQEVKDLVASMKNNETKEWGSLVLTKDKNGKMTAAAKVKTILYDNGKGGKFDLDVATSRAKNIYSDEAISSGETERFTYFSKFFYENLTRTEEARLLHEKEANSIFDQIMKIKDNMEKLEFEGKLLSKEKEATIKQLKQLEAKRQNAIANSQQYFGADLIIGNDWQSGPISAMMRQLTTARKNYGMNPLVANKLHSTPIVTIMHNAGLSGGNWRSQDKLLNIMFGEHAATIARNSYMPNLNLAGKTGGLDARLFNGLMEGDGVNPQMMAVAYSDFLIPVSEGYNKEIATMDVFGGARKKLFEFRAREGAYNNVDNLKLIANQNGIDPALVKDTNPTMVGITNGSDRANNTLTKNKAREIERNLSLPEGTFIPYEAGTDKLEWHNRNKVAAIRKMQTDIDAAKGIGVDKPDNRMQIEMPLETDLSGVTEKTPIFVSAGRIVDQKGLDILAEGIKEFYKDFKGTEYPVFYIQGIGDDKFKEAILAAKVEVAKTNPKAAKRIVFANLFSEKGRYDLSKLITDWSVMPSWFEPCGLSHKEIGQFSGAGSVVNRTGGLTADLHEGLDVIVSDFNPDRNKLHENGQSFAKAMKDAVAIHSDENKYRAVVESMMTTNFDWAREGGPIYSYMNVFNTLGIKIG